jgi:hypothetical protein
MPPSPLCTGQLDGALSDAKKAGANTSAALQNASLNLGLSGMWPLAIWIPAAASGSTRNGEASPKPSIMKAAKLAP